MSSVRGNENLTPDQQLVKYGEILRDLTRIIDIDSTSAKIFTEQFQGDYQKHLSLNLTKNLLKRYDQHNPAPPVADLIGQVHTIFKAGAIKLPKLDIQALDESTQRSIEEFKNTLTEYQKLVADTRKTDSPPNYIEIEKSNRDKIFDKATHILNALNTSELVTSSTIPVIVTSDQDITQHVRVENKENLGLFLFALPHISQNLVNQNRVPKEFSDFLFVITDVAENILKGEVDKVYSNPSLKVQAVATFTSMNEQLHDLFLAKKRVIQVAALVSPLQQEKYNSILNDLGFETRLERLESTLEATLMLESLAHHGESKQLNESVRQFSNHIKDNALPADVLSKTQTALTRITVDNDATKEKVILLQEYIKRQIEASSVASKPGRIRQNTMAVG